MVLRAKYIAIAQRLQEADDAIAAGATATEVQEAGARHSASDMAHLQNAHDSMVALGAQCGMKEAGAGETAGELKLTEAAAFAADITIKEALSPGRKIKLIAPGKGTSAYYTVESLKKAAEDKIFHAGLPMRIDHPTAAQEAERPEGSVKDWGAVLATDAVYLESCVSGGKDLGPGLYSEVKPFSDSAQFIEERGPYAGVSIRANGNAVTEAGKPIKRDGVPILKEFVSAEGADMVTRAGAGGLFLKESAAPAGNPTQEASMDAEELKLLRESLATQQAATNELLAKERRREAIAEGANALKTHTGLTAEQKEYIIGTVLKEALPLKEGALDTVKFTESVTAEAKRYAGTLTGAGRVTGMGAPTPTPIDAKEAERREAEVKKLRESSIRNFMELGQTEEAAKASAAYLVGEVA